MPVNRIIIPFISGDITLSWDPSNEREVALAQEEFNKLTSKGYVAYTIGRKQKPTQFNKEARKLRFKISKTQSVEETQAENEIVLAPEMGGGNTRKQGKSLGD